MSDAVGVAIENLPDWCGVRSGRLSAIARREPSVWALEIAVAVRDHELMEFKFAHPGKSIVASAPYDSMRSNSAAVEPQFQQAMAFPVDNARGGCLSLVGQEGGDYFSAALVLRASELHCELHCRHSSGRQGGKLRWRIVWNSQRLEFSNAGEASGIQFDGWRLQIAEPCALKTEVATKTISLESCEEDARQSIGSRIQFDIIPC